MHMRRSLYIAIFSLALFVFLVAQIPLGVGLKLAGLKAGGLEWASARGTLARGDLLGLSFQRGQGPVLVLGSAEMRHRPLTLITGALGYKVKWAAHSGFATGNASVSPLKTLRVGGANATLKIDQLEGLEPALRILGTVLRINIESLAWRPNAGCKKAKGKIQSNWLSVLAAEFGQEWSEIQGQLKCDGANVLVEMSSESALGEAMKLNLTVLKDGIMDIDLTLVDLKDETVLLAKSTLPDLQDTPEGLKYTYRIGK